jgi:hypothetical protein
MQPGAWEFARTSTAYMERNVTTPRSARLPVNVAPPPQLQENEVFAPAPS